MQFFKVPYNRQNWLNGNIIFVKFVAQGMMEEMREKKRREVQERGGKGKIVLIQWNNFISELICDFYLHLNKNLCLEIIIFPYVVLRSGGGGEGLENQPIFR